MSGPANVDVATRDYTAFTAHVDEKLIHKICQQGLDVTMLTNNSVGQYLISNVFVTPLVYWCVFFAKYLCRPNEI